MEAGRLLLLGFYPVLSLMEAGRLLLVGFYSILSVIEAARLLLVGFLLYAWQAANTRTVTVSGLSHCWQQSVFISVPGFKLNARHFIQAKFQGRAEIQQIKQQINIAGNITNRKQNANPSTHPNVHSDIHTHRHDVQSPTHVHTHAHAHTHTHMHTHIVCPALTRVNSSTVEGDDPWGSSPWYAPWGCWCGATNWGEGVELWGENCTPTGGDKTGGENAITGEEAVAKDGAMDAAGGDSARGDKPDPDSSTGAVLLPASLSWRCSLTDCAARRARTPGCSCSLWVCMSTQKRNTKSSNTWTRSQKRIKQGRNVSNHHTSKLRAK